MKFRWQVLHSQNSLAWLLQMLVVRSVTALGSAANCSNVIIVFEPTDDACIICVLGINSST